jgi:hypothetical protein
MSSEASAQLSSVRSPLMAEFYSRAFERGWKAKTKTEFEQGLDRSDAVAGFESIGPRARETEIARLTKSSETVPPWQIKEENDANTAS